MFASFATNLTSVGSNVEILVGSVIEYMVSGTANDGGKTEISVALNVTVNTSLVEVDKGVGVSIGMTDGLIEPVGTSFAGTIIDDTPVVEYEVSGGVADILTDDASVFEADAVFSISIDARMIDTEVRTCVELTMSDNTSVLKVDVGARFTTDPSPIEIEEGTCVVFDDSLCDILSGIPDTMTNIKSLTWYARGIVIPVTMTNEISRPPIINEDDKGVSMADITNDVLGSINGG